MVPGVAGTGGDQELQGPLHVLIASILPIVGYDGDLAPLESHTGDLASLGSYARDLALQGSHARDLAPWGSHTSWHRCSPGSYSRPSRCPPPAASPRSAEPWRGDLSLPRVPDPGCG